MGTLFVDKLDPQSGTSLEIGSSGDTISVPSGATINLSNATQTGVGGTNTPIFSVRKSGNQTLTSGTSTTITWETEIVDTDSAFASNTFTVPSGKAGKYFVYATIRWNSDSDFEGIRLTLRKNSTTNGANAFSAWGRNEYFQNQYISGIFDLAASDTIDVQCRHTSGSDKDIGADDSGSVSTFGGYKLIE